MQTGMLVDVVDVVDGDLDADPRILGCARTTDMWHIGVDQASKADCS